MTLFENLDKSLFRGSGKYDIPIIKPLNEIPHGDFMPINYAKAEKSPLGKNLHCFVDDYQLIRFWNNPDKYIQMLKRFCAVCSPDFSTYSDMPFVMQIYNHYRKHWLSAYWQMHGIKVYPTISWSTPDSYEWCFDGEPVGSIVAVSSVGCMKNKNAKRLFLQGYEEMMKRLRPAQVIFYGKVPEECDFNIIRIKPHYDSIRKRVSEKREAEGQAAE